MNYRYAILIICVICFSIACDDEPINIIDCSEELKLYDYYVDEFGNEGIVVRLYDYETTKCAIVMSADEAEAVWGPSGFVVFDADSEMLEDHLEHPRFSMMMSRKVIECGVDRFPAFKWCLDKNHGRQLTADSWMLPSYHEFMTILDRCRIDALNDALISIGGMPIINNAYWTCTEDHVAVLSTSDGDYDPLNWAINIIPSYDKSNKYTYYKHKYIMWNKTLAYKVRAIKYIWLVQSYDSTIG